MIDKLKDFDVGHIFHYDLDNTNHKIGEIMKVLLLALISFSVMATTVGLSTHPFAVENRVITTEFDNYTSSGTGMGLTARYYQRVNRLLNYDVGFSINEGDRANRLMVGADYEIFPDYGRQPRLSVKGLFETMEFDTERINSFGAAPTLSKGFSFWGKEAFPFIALPYRVSLNEDQNTYDTSLAFATGITGQLDLGGNNKVVGNIEANWNLQNSYSAIVMGVSVPLN